MANENQWSRVNRNSNTYDSYPATEPPKTPRPPKKNGNGSGGPRKPKKKRHWFLMIFLWLLVLGIIAVMSGVALFMTYANDAPNITESKLASENSSAILDDQGKNIWSLSTVERDYATTNEIPKMLKQSVVATEDRRFYKHNGVDPIRIMGAAVANFRGSSLGMQGGSTLTQQLVKLSVFSTSTADQTIERKAQEAWLAMRVEKNFTKDEILTFYMNKVYMGHGVSGMKTAATYFYGKPLKELSLPQLALLAGMPQSPTNYDPYLKDNSAAKKRRDTVLQSMVKYGAITENQANQAIKVPVSDGLQDLTAKTQLANNNRKVVDGYVQSVLSEANSLGYDVTKSGLKIYTSMDSNLQQSLYDNANGNTVNFPAEDTQIGATMADPKTGRVVAQLGGRNLNILQGTNHAKLSNRSGGSSVKPLLDYGPAIEYLNWPTYRTVEDKKYTLPGMNSTISNWDGKYMNNITMRSALTQSRNTPALRTLEEVGGTNAAKFVNSLGIPTSEVPGGTAAIGIDVSTEQEAGAYGAISNGGTYYKPTYITKVVTPDGTTHNYSATGKRVIKSSTAFMLTDMMKGVIKPNATAAEAVIPGLHQAGKSGLVGYDPSAGQPDRAIMDSWFTGYTKSYVLSVWTGYDQPNEPGKYIPWTSQDLPSQFYQKVMSYAMQNKPNTDWEKPDTVTPKVRGNIVEYEVKDEKWSNGGLPLVNSIPQSGETPAEANISGSAAVGSTTGNN
ncbi:penicillin-binding protein [Leuconostoc carnosum]|uniref:transglycosylase domain-containing protein n=1 Tax=Leuconostoc TaxID=1243 RepID=UPI000D5154A9|nr:MULTISPECIES: transglycosylase domain-containing protein [Leuconostoc]KAA8359689.1 penicillin-binding protein [Leuconostoc carnosum]KAA8365264.1 penicillin-binding protein [Leuconostoc carnosum]KAA8367633.1 penicillin-binding protein [Leuconostoc carnosum]KAA8372826.1 penicillin-binding protein [Leuconostoc carnosum]KAA8381689.1 penicillin-binding protein [Leuconostoc carnosum]